MNIYQRVKAQARRNSLNGARVEAQWDIDEFITETRKQIAYEDVYWSVVDEIEAEEAAAQPRQFSISPNAVKVVLFLVAMIPVLTLIF